MSAPRWPALVDGAFVDELPGADRLALEGSARAGVFDTLLAEDGRAWFVERHLARLADACARWALPPPRAARDEIEALVAALAGRAALVRTTLYAGTGAPRRVVAARAPRAVPLRGVELVVAAAEADPCAGWKTTPRAARDAAARAAQDAGAFEALLALPGGAVVDAARANVWAVLDGRLVTPPLAHGALPGVVRALLLEGLAAAREAPLARADLARASEVFLTSSGLRVAPACAIRDLAPELPGADGPWARAARAALVQAEAAYARETR